METLKKIKIAVLGDGGWGTALSLLLCENGHEVSLWGAFPEYIKKMEEAGENIRFLPGVKLDSRLKLCADMEEASKNAEMVVLASPSQFMRGTLEKFKNFHSAGQILVNVAKGIENDTLFTMSQLCSEMLGKCSYCVLSGPSHAEEVSRRMPTAVVAASLETGVAEKVCKMFMNGYFRVYTGNDVISVELGGALKNVLAIAAGIVDGMGLGDNSKASMMTRGIAEIARFGTALGGNPQTFSGLSGLGDLIVTCMSRHSRNRHVGEELGKGKSMESILAGMGMVVAEGVKTSMSAHQLAINHNVEVPITNEVYGIIKNGKSPALALKDLMNRKARSELDL